MSVLLFPLYSSDKWAVAGRFVEDGVTTGTYITNDPLAPLWAGSSSHCLQVFQLKTQSPLISWDSESENCFLLHPAGLESQGAPVWPNSATAQCLRLGSLPVCIQCQGQELKIICNKRNRIFFKIILHFDYKHFVDAAHDLIIVLIFQDFLIALKRTTPQHLDKKGRQTDLCNELVLYNSGKETWMKLYGFCSMHWLNLPRLLLDPEIELLLISDLMGFKGSNSNYYAHPFKNIN